LNEKFNNIIKSVFERALELDKLSRESFFQNLNEEEKKYEKEVKSLLEAYEGNDDFLEIKTSRGIFSEDNIGPHPLIGKHIGTYLIEEEIGVGGMGIVFSGKRDDQEFDQKVAIKILKQGLTSEYLVKRFENERQTLANLQHPNIAKLFDGGKTDEGLPYLVMEYIDGVPITKYCSDNKLTVDETLKLFVTVCNAIQYAHKNLIIHRDIKPENILVNNDGRPKLLDFGVSKLLDEDIVSTNAGLTKTGTYHLTPEYASPEQIKGETINTSSDIYSLGVLLYRLLSLQLPYKIYNSSPLAISKILDEGKVLKPSDVLIKKTEETKNSKSVDEINSAIYKELSKKLKGDLDNIVLKAMHKDSGQRYTLVQDLATDIERYMNGQTVSAREDTYSYRFTKFVQRHKVGVAMFVLFNVLVASGIIAIIYQGRLAAKERDKAKIENAKFEKVNSFLQEMLASVDPSEIGRDVKVYDVLEKAAENVKEELRGQPEVEASIRSTLGNTYVNLGEYDKGKPFLDESYRINKGIYGEESKEVAENIHDLGLYYDWVGDYKKADSLYGKSIDLFRVVLEEPTKIFGDALNNHAIVKMHFSEYDVAEKLYLEAIDISRKVEGEKSRNLAVMMNNLAYNYTDAGKYDDAKKYYKESLEIILEVLGENRPEAGTAYNNLAWLNMQQNEYDSAEVYLERSYKLKYNLKGEDHPDIGLALNNLGVLQIRKKNYEKAEQYLLDAIKQYRKTYEKDHPLVAVSNYWLGKVYRELDKLKLSEDYFRKCLKSRLIKMPKDNWEIWDTKGELGITLLERKKYNESEKLLKTSYDYFFSKEQPDTTRAANFLEGLVQNYKETNQKEKHIEFSSVLESFKK